MPSARGAPPPPATHVAGDEDKGAAVARSRASRASLITSPDGSVMPSPITLIAARPVSVAATAATAATNQPTTASVVRRLLPPTRAAVARLLLIEDDPAISRLLLRALRDSGHTVAVAGTAMAGLRGALDDRPDLVVLDLGLPDLDGLELLRMLRAVSRVPAIISTARDDEARVAPGTEPRAADPDEGGLPQVGERDSECGRGHLPGKMPSQPAVDPFSAFSRS